MNKFIIISLIAFLILFAVFAWLNHSCFVQSDPHTFLNFASSLAEGNYFIDYPPEKLLVETLPPEDYYRTFYGHIAKGGKSFSMVGIGYPFFLSLFIRLGGLYAPFFVNGLLFIGVFIALYLFTSQLFGNHQSFRLIAILTVLLYFLINREHIVELFRNYRDPMSYMFMLFGMWLFLKFINEGKRYPSLILSGIFLGLACTARETAFLCVLPMGLIYFVKSVRDKSFHILKPGLLLAIFFVIGCSPLLVQNYVNSGNPFLHTQNIARRSIFAANEQSKPGVANFIVPGSKLKYFRFVSRSYLRQLWGKYGAVFTALFMLGVYFSRKEDSTILLLLPFIIMYFIFYCMVSKAPWRYIFVIHMAIVPLVSYGLVHLIKIVLRIDDRFVKVGLAILVLFTAMRIFANVPEKPFQVKQARSFASDIDRVMPENSLILAERTLRSNIDYFTKSYCIRIGDLLESPSILTVNSALEGLMNKFDGVYFFDNIDWGLSHKFDYTPVTRQKILSNFDLRHVKDFNGEDYNLLELFGKDVCGLWKVKPWKQKRSSQSIQVDRVEDSILIINARKLWDGNFERKSAELYFNDNLLDAEIKDGVNFIFIPKELITKAKSVIELRSDAPVPADIGPKLQSIYDDINIDVGAESVPLDDSFISGTMLVGRPQFRNITRETKIQLPVLNWPQSFLVITATTWLEKTAPSDCILTIFCDGKEVAVQKIQRSGAPKSFDLLVPYVRADGESFDISFGMELIDASGQSLLDQTVPDRFLLLDKLVIRREFVKLHDPLIDVGAEDELYVKSGFYKPEKHQRKHSVRWTRRKAVLRLPTLDPDRGYRLEVNAWGCPEVIGEKVSAVYLNDHKLGDMKVGIESLQSFTFDVSPEMLARGLNELTIITPTWRPRYLTNTLDNRLLGIMLDSVDLDWSD